MTSTEILREIERTGVVAIIRAADSAELINVVKALREGGLTCIEVTMTTPNALAVIAEARKACGDTAAIGVGTVLDPETARAAMLAGAQFVVTPVVHLPTIEMCKRYGVPVIPGGMTPTEILTCWQVGADMVKVFPTSSLGAQMIRDLKGPFPQIKLIPTGGVTLDTVADFMKAGSTAVGVGSSLVTKSALRNRDWAAVRDTAAEFLRRVAATRAPAA